jgi:uncharacterized protein
MRNHEVSYNDTSNGPYKPGQNPNPKAYDPKGMGGVTRLVVNATTFERISSNLVLIGTIRNCAGGPSPWGWLSCEENVDKPGAYRHGYTFLCSTSAASVKTPQRIVGYGRFNHEAAAVDPSNYRAYLTEDRSDSCVYRFVPDDMSQPFIGQLQALKVVGEDEFDTDNMDLGEVVDVEWVDIDSPNPNSDTVRDEGHAKGAAIISRGEGIWFHEGQVYICSTNGGGNGGGNVFRLTDGNDPTLELVVQSPDLDELDGPDNITVAPWGDLFFAEDNGGENFIRWVTLTGDGTFEIRPFARNAGPVSEFAGVCFSPDGEAMFVNMQATHRTIVITGPFWDVLNANAPEHIGGRAWEPDGESDVGSDIDGNCTVTNDLSDQAALVTGLAPEALGTLARDRE